MFVYMLRLFKHWHYFSSLNIYICFVDTCTPPYESVGDGCYFYYGGLFVASFSDANTVCHGLGGYLSMIKSGDENRAVIDNFLLQNSNYFYFVLQNLTIITLHLG